MWPMLLDYTNEECRRNLRKLELEAYASVVSAFRAQGEMSKDKKKMLQELSTTLSIPLERHRAEIRRAVNDEHLNTIAERIAGPNTSAEWSIEGRRVVPLMRKLVPQTPFTAIANYAADAQAAKNASLPVPSSIGIKESSENISPEELQCNHKRSSSAEPESTPQKLLVLESSSLSTKPCDDNDDPIKSEDSDYSLHCASQVPECVLQSIMGKDSALFTKKKMAKNSFPAVSQKSLLTSPSPTKITTTGETITSTASGLPPKPVNVPVVKTVSAPVLSQQGKCSSSSCQNTVLNTFNDFALSSCATTSADIAASINSVTTPLFSAPSGLPHSVSVASTMSTCSFINRSKTKVLPASKPPMKPRITTGSMFTGPSPIVTCQNSTLLQPINKAVSPLKTRATHPAVALPSGSSPSNSSSQNVLGSPIFSKSQSSISTVSRATTPVTNSQRAISPVTLKQQTTVPLTTVSKAIVTPKSVAKPSALRPPLGPRAVIAPVTKATSTPKPLTSAGQCTTSPRPSLQVSVKPHVTTYQPLPPGKANVAYTQKAATSQNPSKPGNSTTKAVHYRSDSGLKIISQNMSNNWLLPKSTATVTAQNSTATQSKVTTATTASGITGSARIINFSQPVSARFARATPPSAVSAVNLSNNLTNSGLRVALPVGVNSSSIVRASIPAKPNVIVVHKAQVWPQTPGATIVMTSSGSLSRLSNEAIEEAVSLMQRQETNRSATTFKAVTLQQPSFSPSINTISHSQPMKTAVRKTCEQSQIETSTANYDGHVTEKVIVKEKIVEKSSATATPASAVQKERTTAPTSVVSTENVVQETRKQTQSSSADSLLHAVNNKNSANETKCHVMEKGSDLITAQPILPSKAAATSSQGSVKKIEKLELQDMPLSPDVDQLAKQANLVSLPEDGIKMAADFLNEHGELGSDIVELLQQAEMQVDKMVALEAVSTKKCKGDASEVLFQSLKGVSDLCEKIVEKGKLSLASTAPSIQCAQKSESNEATSVINDDLSFMDVLSMENKSNKDVRETQCNEIFLDQELSHDDESLKDELSCNDAFLVPAEKQTSDLDKADITEVSSGSEQLRSPSLPISLAAKDISADVDEIKNSSLNVLTTNK